MPEPLPRGESSSPPAVSVLMPVFNGGRYLAASVQSILDQSFRDFEFLILNDGSSDDSLMLLQRFARQDARIRIISRDNRGLTHSLNELLANARGVFIARMDADDIALGDRFQLQLDYLDANPDVACVGGAYQMIDEDGRYLTTLSAPRTDEEIQKCMLQGHCAINHPTVMARREILNTIGGYHTDCDTAEDLDLWLRLGEVGKLANLGETLIKYRLHNKSVSERAGNQQRDAMRRACEKAWRRRNITTGSFEAGQLWRPASGGDGQHRFMLQYGWWAWNSRERRTAQVYGLKALKSNPLSSASWRLLLVSILKPLPRSMEPDRSR